jgi:hypothetical protein
VVTVTPDGIFQTASLVLVVGFWLLMLNPSRQMIAPELAFSISDSVCTPVE